MMGQLRDFPWPCDRREAHGPHDDVDATNMSPEGYRAAVARDADLPTCPGVPSHPLTMAGGAWRE